MPCRSCIPVLAVAALAGCGHQEPPLAATPLLALSVSQPVVREVVDYDEYEGRIEAVKRVEIRARVRGHLTKILFEDGQIVKQGQQLFEIDRVPYEARLEMSRADQALNEAQLRLAVVELQRAQAIKKANPGAISQQEIDRKEAEKDKAEAAVKAAVAKVKYDQQELDYTKILAPMTGKIGRRQVDLGHLVNAGGGDTLLATVVTTEPMYVTFNVDERALLRYRQMDSDSKSKNASEAAVKALKIPVFVGLEGEEGFSHEGQLDFIDYQVNPATGTIQVRGVLRNPQLLLSDGMRARVRVPISDPHKALLIAERAVGTDQGLKFVYLVNAQDVVERRDVKLDRVVDGLQIVREGLKPEDWVVVNGLQRARDGLKVEPRRLPMPGTETAPPSTPSR